jgi:uncharacterized membrane protein YfcA
VSAWLLEPGAGAITGFIVGLTGVGGGALMTPILLLFFGIAPHAAVGTDLWFAALTKLAITPTYRSRGLIDWIVLRRLWIGSLPASALTLVWMRSVTIPARFLTAAIAVTVILTAIGLLIRGPLQRRAREHSAGSATSIAGSLGPATISAGVVLGICVTLTSIGAGALGAVMLAYLYPARLTPARLVATDIAHAIPLAMFAGMGHLFAGAVDLRLLLCLLAGSIPAGLVGAFVSARLPATMLQVVLALLLLAIGCKLAIVG